MANRFLSTTAATDLAQTDLTVNSIRCNNLSASQPLRTDGNRRLVSSNLNIADIDGLQAVLNSTLQTPFDGTIQATDFETTSTTLNALSTLVTNLETRTQQISLAPTYVQGTAIVGCLAVFSAGQDPDAPVQPTGQVLCGTIRASEYGPLVGDTVEMKSNLNVQNVSAGNVVCQGNFETNDVLFDGTRCTFYSPVLIGELLVTGGLDLQGASLLRGGQGTFTTLNVSQGNFVAVSTNSINGLSVTDGKYSQTTPAVVQNTIVETSILTGTNPTFTFRLGDTYRLFAAGTYESDGKGQEVLIQFKLATTVFHTLVLNGNGGEWSVTMHYLARSASIVSSLQFEADTTTTETPLAIFPNSQVFTATAQWAQANIGSIFTVKQLVITKVF